MPIHWTDQHSLIFNVLLYTTYSPKMISGVLLDRVEINNNEGPVIKKRKIKREREGSKEKG